jgi:hypothetical protein
MRESHSSDGAQPYPETQDLVNGKRVLCQLVRGLKITEITFQPRQFSQDGRFATLIAYVAGDSQSFVQAFPALVEVAGISFEGAESAKGAGEFGTIVGDPEDRERRFEMVASFFRLAKPGIGFPEIRQRGCFAVRVVRLATKRQSLRM